MVKQTALVRAAGRAKGGKRLVLPLIVLLLLVGAVALVIGFDSETLKARLVAEVRATTGRELAIDGPLRLRLLPRLAVEAEGIRLSAVGGFSPAPDTPPPLSLAALTGAIKIIPLLHGQVVVNRLELRDLVLRATRNSDGTTDFDDLLALESEGESSWSVDVEHATLLDAAFLWRDEALARQLELHNVYLHVGHLGKQARGELELGGRLRLSPLADAASPEAEANLKASSKYWINGGEAFLQLDDTRLAAKGNFFQSPFHFDLSNRRLRSSTAPGKNAEAGGIAALKLEGFLLQGEWQQEETGEVSARWQGSVRLAAVDTSSGEALLRDFEASLERWQGEQKSAALKASLPQLAWREQHGLGRLQLSAEGIPAGDNRISGEATVPLDVLFAITPKEAGRLTVSDAHGRLEVLPGGVLQQPLHLDWRLSAVVNSIFAAQQHERGVHPEAAGQVQLTLDDSHLQADWRLTQIEPLRLEFAAELDRLDLDRYLGAQAPPLAASASGLAAPTSMASGGPPVLPMASSVAPSPSAGSEQMALQGHVRVGQLRFRGVQLDDVKGEATWADGALAFVEDPPPSPPKAKKAVRKKKAASRRRK